MKPNRLPLVSIIIPVFNESDYIISTLSQVNLYTKKIEVEIIVVDDGSFDGTLEKLRLNNHLYSQLITLTNNLGKGMAVREGFKRSFGEYILIQDADPEYNPQELPRLIQIAIENRVDLLLTTRINGSSLTRVHYFWHRLGNKVITFVFNILFNTTFTDLYSGYLLIRREFLDFERIKSNGWAQQSELIAAVISRKNSRVFETPISYHGRTYVEGKKIRAFAIVPILFHILRCRIWKSTKIVS